jgi:hypothetical protein
MVNFKKKKKKKKKNYLAKISAFLINLLIFDMTLFDFKSVHFS